MILTRGSRSTSPLGELRKRNTEEATRAPAQPDDIARIVKETISALGRKKDVATSLRRSGAKKSSGHSLKARDGLAAPTEPLREWASIAQLCLRE